LTDQIKEVVDSAKENCKEDVVLDFSNVKFATRSFIDEFYNLFMKNPSANTFKGTGPNGTQKSIS